MDTKVKAIYLGLLNAPRKDSVWPMDAWQEMLGALFMGSEFVNQVLLNKLIMEVSSVEPRR